MNGRDIVMMSLQNWGESLGSNSYNLAIEFARINRVLYINRAPDRISQIKSVLKGEKKDANEHWITNPQENIFVLHTKTVLESINKLPSFVFDYMNRLNGKKLAAEIKHAIEKLDFKSNILFIDNDFFRGQYLKEFLRPSLFIYYIRDNLRIHPYFKKHGQSCEESIAAKADLIVANSPYLAELLQPFNEHTHDIGQGCDFSLFHTDRIEKPDDFPANQKPTIGYVGNIVSYRLDLKMLELICTKRQDWNWVFVGPTDDAFQRSLLSKLPHVHFLGTKNENELWKYIQHMDVCINPQLKNELTEGNYPRKIDEYLYMGKPVVAAKTAFMKYFSEYALLYTDLTGFETQIEIGLKKTSDESDIQKRKAFASSHSWPSCAEKIYDALNAQ
jgi:glycosyltransferase involved in cell wall biosynthesis